MQQRSPAYRHVRPDFRQFFLALFLFTLMGAGTAEAHALLAKVVGNHDVCVVECAYSSGEKARFAEAKVYAPDNTDTEYQNGRTDSQGRFAFLPHTSGAWKIVVRDGMGHRVAHTFNVKLSGETNVTGSAAMDAAQSPTDLQHALWSTSLLFRVFLGLSLLANIFLALSLWRHKSSRHSGLTPSPCGTEARS